MFISNLNLEQQSALLKCAEILIHSDDIVSKEEDAIWDVLKAQCDSNVVMPTNFELASLRELFDDEKDKVSFLLELIAVAFIDDEYHEKEESLLDEIARIIDVTPKKLGRLESWVIRQLDLNNSALKLME